ncbi:FMRFamide-related peptides [Eurosta solidaginis]|uniref:FMRFamide-related peptides n=1 Tax=Eurosta solidaginis TaxID=178769 RepID=UPI0035310CA0
MGPLLVFLLYILQMQASIRSEIIENANDNLNAISESEDDDFNGNESNEHHASATTTTHPLDLPFVKTGRDQTEVEFRYPIVSLNVDYSKNLIVLKFRKPKFDEEEARRRKALDENFMRFGRDASDFMRFGRSSGDFMRFGKRAFEQVPKVNSLDYKYMYDKDSDTGRRFERSQESIRDSRGDNFMRFGRPSEDFMRFGRGANDFLRFGRNTGSSSDFMRFGRGGTEDFIRFGRNPKIDFMRFGRMSKDISEPSRDFMRFGRPDNFMRFGRSSTRPTVAPSSIRFGKLDKNFMRFGKSMEHQLNENSTKPPLPKEVIKEAAKILHHAEQFGGEGESNPMDRAFKVLFGKQNQQEITAQDDKIAQNMDETSNSETERDYELN